MSQGAPRVSLVNLGCRVNRVELDAMARSLTSRGLVLAEGEGQADAVVVNTCAVTAEAEAKARKRLRHAARDPRVRAVVACGCAANLFSDELSSLDEKVVVEPDKSRVAERVVELLAVEGEAPGTMAPLHGTTPTGRTRPGIKVQDGCDRRCTYCIVWKARGAARSLPFEQVLAEVRDLVGEGAGEVVLTGIDLGAYDDGGRDLAGLLEGLLEETGVGRLRLSSVEPVALDDGVISLMAAEPRRIAPFLHLPLQSGCDRTLHEMGRPYDHALYRSVVERVRARVPGVAIACDLIVGFPGESEEDFEASLSFCREMAFSSMHVFRYSRRSGTPAAARTDQVDPRVSAARSREVRELARAMAMDYARSRVGEPEWVCVEERGRGVTGGLVEVALGGSHGRGELVPFVARDVLEGPRLV